MKLSKVSVTFSDIATSIPSISIDRPGFIDIWNATTHICSIQISFASNYFYDFGMGFPKLSMLAFYWLFFDFTSHPAMRKVLWAMTAFVVACYLTILFDDTFFCGKNVSVQWSQEDGACSVFYAKEPFIVNFTLNLACYLVVYSIPLILLIQGVLKSSRGVSLTFALGTLTILSGVVRFVCLNVGTGQENLVCKFLQIETACSYSVCALTQSSQTPSAWWRWSSQSLLFPCQGSSHFSGAVRRARGTLLEARAKKNNMRSSQSPVSHRSSKITTRPSEVSRLSRTSLSSPATSVCVGLSICMRRSWEGLQTIMFPVCLTGRYLVMPTQHRFCTITYKHESCTHISTISYKVPSRVCECPSCREISMTSYKTSWPRFLCCPLKDAQQPLRSRTGSFPSLQVRLYHDSLATTPR